MKLSKRESRLVSIALLAAVVFIYYLYFLSPKIDEYNKLKEEVEQNKQELGTLKAAESELAKLMDSINSDKKEITRLEGIIPSSKKLPEIIVQMESLSHEAGLKLKKVSFETPSEGKDNKAKNKDVDTKEREYAEISVKLSLTGTYDQILNFLRSVEETERIYSVRSIILAREYEVAQSSIDADIELSTFAVKHDGELLDDPGAYEFMNGTYGRENPFKPLLEETAAYTVPAVDSSKSSTVNMPSDEFIEDMMERLFDQILKDLMKQ